MFREKLLLICKYTDSQMSKSYPRQLKIDNNHLKLYARHDTFEILYLYILYLAFIIPIYQFLKENKYKSNKQWIHFSFKCRVIMHKGIDHMEDLYSVHGRSIFCTSSNLYSVHPQIYILYILKSREFNGVLVLAYYMHAANASD